jgi:hypothetical protein
MTSSMICLVSWGEIMSKTTLVTKQNTANMYQPIRSLMYDEIFFTFTPVLPKMAEISSENKKAHGRMP